MFDFCDDVSGAVPVGCFTALAVTPGLVLLQFSSYRALLLPWMAPNDVLRRHNSPSKPRIVAAAGNLRRWDAQPL